jgi:hypothetical protein
MGVVRPPQHFPAKPQFGRESSQPGIFQMNYNEEFFLTRHSIIPDRDLSTAVTKPLQVSL